MSQEKVDKYKQEKKNRAQIMKKQKRNSFLIKAAGCLVALVLVCWVGISIYHAVVPKKSNTYTVDAAALNDYITQLNVETESETDAGESEEKTSEEEGSETATEAETETQSAQDDTEAE